MSKESDMENPNPAFIVDGHVCDDPEVCDLQGDGEHAPFRIFDVARQEHLAPRFSNRLAATVVCLMLNQQPQTD
jgi:hypothetical protein